jgi:hypothetical protein
MKSHRQFVRRLRRLAIGLVAIVALVPVGAAWALQDPGSSPSAHDAAAKVGDTPADFPGASGAPDVPPTTIEVVRPERTIVRDVDEALPIALSGAALLIVLMGAAFVLVRVRVERRHAVGRSH